MSGPTSSQLAAAYTQGENTILKQQNSFLQNMQMSGQNAYNRCAPFVSSFMGSFMGNCCSNMMNSFRCMGFGPRLGW